MGGTLYWTFRTDGKIYAANNTTSILSVAEGTSTSPGLQFGTGGSGHGFSFNGGPFLNLMTSGERRASVHDFGIVIGSGSRYGFSSSNLNTTQTADVALERDTSTRLAVTDASISHNARDLKLRACLYNADTYANRPGSAVKGMVICVNDSTVNTFGATLAGGGGNSVLAWFNGSNWTVIGI